MGSGVEQNEVSGRGVKKKLENKGKARGCAGLYQKKIRK